MRIISRIAPCSLRLVSRSQRGWRQPVWLASLTWNEVATQGYHSQAKKRRKEKKATDVDRSPLTRLGVPTLAVASDMPMSCQEMDNKSLVILSTLGNYDARVEVLKRHIMIVDRVSYDNACKTFLEIHKENRKHMWLSTVPYQLGIASALLAGVVSFPLCFHLPTVEWFNHHFVTTSVPEPEDLETILEVGNWMEPPLGQISFFLLCLQFSRAQLENMGIRPYTKKMKILRGKRVAAKFFRYDPKIIQDFSAADEYFQDN